MAKADRRGQVLLAAILVAAAVVRLVGITWGLPLATRLCSYHPDEAPLLAAVGNMLRTGDWNPHFFNYGTLYLYLVAVPAAVINHVVSDIWPWLFWIGRLWSVCLGVGTVYLVYQLGRWAGGPRLGLVAGAVMAFLPMHLLHSHFATVDVAATFFIMVVLLACARITTEADMPWYLLAGAAAGFAAATKYTAGLSLLALPVAHMFGVGRGRNTSPPQEWLYIGLLLAVVAFVVGCPFAFQVKDGVPGLSPDFVRGFTFELQHAQAGGTFAFVGTGNGWLYQLARGLGAGLGYPLLVLGLAGLVLAPWSMGRTALPGVVFGVLYFVIAGFGKEHFLRYLLPLAPLAALWSVALVLWLADLLFTSKAKVAGVAVLVVGGLVWAGTAWYGAAQLWPLAQTDARTLAGRDLLGAKGRIGLVSAPWYFTPDVSAYNGGPLTEKVAPPDPRLVVTGWDPAALRRKRPAQVAVSDLESMDLLRLKSELAVAWFAALERRYQRAAVYETPVPRPPLGPAKADCPPDWLYARPRIEVWRVK